MNQEQEKQDKAIDLSRAFDESNKEIRSGAFQPAPLCPPGTPKMIQWIIKYSKGLIKDEKQASYVLLGFIALVVVISLFLLFGRRGPMIFQKTEIINPDEAGSLRDFAP